jgi:transcription-repair coupling factor (superfamily II helicase)
MNTLSFPGLLRKIDAFKPVSACVSAVMEGKFPLEIEGSEGAFGALVLAKLYLARPALYFVVVPQENDAFELCADLAASGLPCLQFPWWGVAPYHELPPSSAVFGERIKVLSELVTGKPCIVIIPQRAFLNPLPPRDYIKGLLVSIKPGDSIDITALAQTLVLYGYTRVPRVQVHGEFALRGEVLDILMSGSDLPADTAKDDTAPATFAEAYRILFDFDKVESIKQFDPLMPASFGVAGGGADRKKIPELLIRPMREVIWTDERIEVLEKNLAVFKEFTNGGKDIIEELIEKRCIAGEEMFYPLAFEERGVGSGEDGETA